MDLSPPGAFGSSVFAISGDQQVGYVNVEEFVSHASLWSGSAASWVDLNPSGAMFSRAHGVSDTKQCGYAHIDGVSRAVVWSGTAESWVDLSAFLPGSWSSSYAQGVWSNGATTYVVGSGFNNDTGRDEALLWIFTPDQVDCPGDTNGDGIVNFTDLNAVLASFGESGEGIAGDVNGDGLVNFADLNAVLANFGVKCE